MQFKLCEPCWRSRSIDCFYKNNNVCKDCLKQGRTSYFNQYKKEQSKKPVNERLRICSECIEEKNASKSFEGSRRVCFSCRGKKNWQRIVASGGYNEQTRETYNRAQRKYNKRRKLEDEEFKMIVKSYGKAYRAKLKGLENLMPSDWWNILLEICQYKCLSPGCLKKLDETNPLTHDHVIPVTVEGSIHSLGNSQVLCKSCNSSKQNRNSEDYRTEEMKEKLLAYDNIVKMGLVAV